MLFHPEEVRDCRYSPNGTRILTIGDRFARLWDAATGKPLTELLKHEEYIWTAKFTPDGRRFVTLSMHPNATSDEEPHLRQVRVYDVQTGQLAYPPLTLPGVAPRVWFTPDGQRFILMVKDTVQIRHMESGELVHEPLRHPRRCLQSCHIFTWRPVVDRLWSSRPVTRSSRLGRGLRSIARSSDFSLLPLSFGRGVQR